MVELLFVVLECLLCHDLEVEDEHDHHTILVLHWHHIHHTQEAVTCVGRGIDKAQTDCIWWKLLSRTSYSAKSVYGFRTGIKTSNPGEVIWGNSMRVDSSRIASLRTTHKFNHFNDYVKSYIMNLCAETLSCALWAVTDAHTLRTWVFMHQLHRPTFTHTHFFHSLSLSNVHLRLIISHVLFNMRPGMFANLLHEC